MKTRSRVTFDFSGQRVLVTGGGRGLGLEIARQFATAGATVEIFDANPKLLAEARRGLRRWAKRIVTTEVDVSRRAEVEAAVAAVEKRGPIDVLVNNAGIASESGFLRIPEAEWRRILDVNLTGAFLVAQAVARRMARRRRGVVLNMSSKNGLAGEAGYAHYNASKGGLIMLTRTMALELSGRGVRVNAVCPGYLVTPMSAEIDSPAFVREFVREYIPLRRHGTPEDVAPTFLFLASEAASFITGQLIVMDGGQIAGQNPTRSVRQRLGL